MTRVQTSDTASPRARTINRRSARPANHFFRTAFETVGPADAPAVVVLGGISASRHVTATESDPRQGWWQAFVGPAKVIDTNRFRVLGIDYLSAGRRNRPLSTHDQALALAAALDRASIQKVRAIVGASYGGMVAL